MSKMLALEGTAPPTKCSGLKGMKQGMKGKGGRQMKHENKSRRASSFPIPAVPFALANKQNYCRMFLTVSMNNNFKVCKKRLRTITIFVK